MFNSFATVTFLKGTLHFRTPCMYVKYQLLVNQVTYGVWNIKPTNFKGMLIFRFLILFNILCYAKTADFKYDCKGNCKFCIVNMDEETKYGENLDYKYIHPRYNEIYHFVCSGL